MGLLDAVAGCVSHPEADRLLSALLALWGDVQRACRH